MDGIIRISDSDQKKLASLGERMGIDCTTKEGLSIIFSKAVTLLDWAVAEEGQNFYVGASPDPQALEHKVINISSPLDMRQI